MWIDGKVWKTTHKERLHRLPEVLLSNFIEWWPVRWRFWRQKSIDKAIKPWYRQCKEERRRWYGNIKEKKSKHWSSKKQFIRVKHWNPRLSDIIESPLNFATGNLINIQYQSFNQSWRLSHWRRGIELRAKWVERWDRIGRGANGGTDEARMRESRIYHKTITQCNYIILLGPKLRIWCNTNQCTESICIP